MLFVVFVSAVLALSAPAVQGQVYGWGQCPNVPVATNFQVDRWVGTWFEIARTSNKMEENMDCGTDTMKMVDGNVLKRCRFIRDGIAIELDPLRIPNTVASPEEPAKFSVPYFSSSFLPDMPFWILEVDHDPQTGYYVGFTCRDIRVGNMQLLWVMSKERQMDEGKLKGILGRLEGHGIDTSKLEYPRQDDTCPAMP